MYRKLEYLLIRNITLSGDEGFELQFHATAMPVRYATTKPYVINILWNDEVKESISVNVSLAFAGWTLFLRAKLVSRPQVCLHEARSYIKQLSTTVICRQETRAFSIVQLIYVYWLKS
jgi:hypothetical protein